MRGTNAAVYRGELAIRAGLADRLGTLDLAIAEMAAELDQAAAPARIIINPTPKRSTSMATNETEQIAHDAERAATAARVAGSAAGASAESRTGSPADPGAGTGARG